VNRQQEVIGVGVAQGGILPNQLDEILRKMAGTHEKLLTYLATLDDDGANRPVGAEHWSPRAMVGHLADAERAHRRFLQAVADGNPPARLDGFDLDAWNAARVARRAGQTLAETLADFEAERAQTLAYLPTIPAEAWTAMGDHPVFGHVSVEYVVRVIGIHERMHLTEMMG
jgi:uncharacterized damage-inducible protein DinB